MKINEFAASTTPTVKFANVGDRVAGVIVEEPELQPDKFGSAGDVVLVLVICDDENVVRRLYARKQMLTAIGQAVSDADVDEIESGGRLSVEYVDDKPTGGTTAMKVYVAEYSPPASIGAGQLEAVDDAPAW